MSFLNYAPLLLVFVAGAVGAARFGRLDPALRCLAGLIFFEIFVELLSRAVTPNLFVLPADTMVEFGALAWMYRRAFWPSALSRWLPAVVAVFAAASLVSYAEPARLLQFNTVQRFAESLLVLGLVLRYFYTVIRELAIEHLEREPLFWVSVGLLLYFSGNVFIFISSNYVIQHSKTLSLRLWDVHALLYMVLNGLYAVALWISPSTRK
ncbi:hypothetical protein [Hymenobacter ruricola]|uniref:Uncharacterized protein n=1 Tax=Hymenobacter ruricola TaxID=2791023 RepID=A0ABS0I9W8_9BACT|nr:hypothetical protein [Hymenobacter ruricola]MBF9223764.1 hypothetical protein [Hymenobacter ruricola]